MDAYLILALLWFAARVCRSGLGASLFEATTFYPSVGSLDPKRPAQFSRFDPFGVIAAERGPVLPPISGLNAEDIPFRHRYDFPNGKVFNFPDRITPDLGSLQTLLRGSGLYGFDSKWRGGTAGVIAETAWAARDRIQKIFDDAIRQEASGISEDELKVLKPRIDLRIMNDTPGLFKGYGDFLVSSVKIDWFDTASIKAGLRKLGVAIEGALSRTSSSAGTDTSFRSEDGSIVGYNRNDIFSIPTPRATKYDAGVPDEPWSFSMIFAFLSSLLSSILSFITKTISLFLTGAFSGAPRGPQMPKRDPRAVLARTDSGSSGGAAGYSPNLSVRSVLGALVQAAPTDKEFSVDMQGL